MYAAAAGHSTLGIPKSVGEKFVATDKPGTLPMHVGHALGGATANDVIDAATRIARQPFQAGGFSSMSAESPWWERTEARQIDSPYGFSMGTGGGRTDKNNVGVLSGSYVLPADVVSGLGEGNSLFGAAVVDRMIRSLPYGIHGESGGHRGSGPPRAPAPARDEDGVREPPIQPGLAKGGATQAGEEENGEVPIATADGEVILHPDQVMAFGDAYFPHGKTKTRKALISHGHAILDQFVKETRGRVIKELETLPGPKGSKNSSEGHKKAA